MGRYPEILLMRNPSSGGVEGAPEFFGLGGQADSDQRAMANLKISTPSVLVFGRAYR